MTLEFHQKDATFFERLIIFHDLNESRLRESNDENPYRFCETRLRGNHWTERQIERPYFILNETTVTFEREFSKHGRIIFEQLMSFKKGEEVNILNFTPHHPPFFERGTIEEINPASHEVLINNMWVYYGRLFKLDEKPKWEKRVFLIGIKQNYYHEIKLLKICIIEY